MALEPRESLFRRMVAYSAAFHVAIFIAGALWMTLRVPPVLIAPVAVVDLIGGGQFKPPAPAPAAAPQAPAPAPKAEEKAREREPEPKTAPRAAEKKEKKAPPQQARVREVPPTDTREFYEKIRRMREERATTTQVRQAVESIQREKAIRAAVKGIGERVAHRVDLSGVRPQPKGTAAAEGMPGAAGTARVAPEILAYARLLDEKVRANWTVPALAEVEAKKLMVQVRITIEKDGRVSNVRMERVSANPYFDDSVRRAIQKASPLPIPPEQLRGGEDHYDVGFRFYGGEGSS